MLIFLDGSRSGIATQTPWRGVVALVRLAAFRLLGMLQAARTSGNACCNAATKLMFECRTIGEVHIPMLVSSKIDVKHTPGSDILVRKCLGDGIGLVVMAACGKGQKLRLKFG